MADWHGPDMRRGDWPARGKLTDLTASCDSVLVWTGNTHEVTVHSSVGGGAAHSNTFVRHGGMIDLMPAGTHLHEVEWRGGVATCVAVNLTSGALRDLFGDRAPRLDPEQRPRFGISDPHVVDLVGRLHDQLVLGEPLGAAYVHGLSLTLASYLFAAPELHHQSHAPGRALPRLDVEAIVAFVEEHLGGYLGLVELAKVAGYSPDHFARQFKRTFRQSPYQYILARRIERAKTLLREPRRSIADVALAAGFSSQAHLSAIFKRSTGVTPGRYRKG